MKTVTSHSAKTHFSHLLKEVQSGETFIILHGTEPIAQLSATGKTAANRPAVGVVTSGPVCYSAETFTPLNEKEMEAWGL